jgi:hypothetical protein
MRTEPTVAVGVAGLLIGVTLVTALIAGLCVLCDR